MSLLRSLTSRSLALGRSPAGRTWNLAALRKHLAGKNSLASRKSLISMRSLAFRKMV